MFWLLSLASCQIFKDNNQDRYLKIMSDNKAGFTDTIADATNFNLEPSGGKQLIAIDGTHNTLDISGGNTDIITWDKKASWNQLWDTTFTPDNKTSYFKNVDPTRGNAITCMTFNTANERLVKGPCTDSAIMFRSFESKDEATTAALPPPPPPPVPGPEPSSPPSPPSSPQAHKHPRTRRERNEPLKAPTYYEISRCKGKVCEKKVRVKNLKDAVVMYRAKPNFFNDENEKWYEQSPFRDEDGRIVVSPWEEREHDYNDPYPYYD
ncbi:hypothetical protein ENBRE01_2398 [Enteropsectra breve]|nr:hypothetical protein ENBRE01_2398 [Enteropsectra breve]